MRDLLLRADRALLGTTMTADAWVRVAGGRIVATGAGDAGAEPDASVALLVPGFVDLHCHGGAGAAFDDEGADWDAALALHAAHGTTAQALSLVSAPIGALVPRVRAAAVRAAADDRVLGIHLEGPFLAASHRGAHDPAALTAPTAEAVEALLEAGDGRLLQVTMAPELPASYDHEDPIVNLEAAGFTDLLGEFQGEDAYTYVFDGMLGYLDYGLADADLVSSVVGAAAWHANTDEPGLIDYTMEFKQDAQDALWAPDAYRASDHDAVVIGLDLAEDDAECGHPVFGDDRPVHGGDHPGRGFCDGDGPGRGHGHSHGDWPRAW
ncbi:amidohydrolase family protein [Agrococcus terreus]|uniref:amidohydrolase family protein n=1 Tax=Agrococcus terreus TaxID=574649 RepID=UPI00384A683E